MPYIPVKRKTTVELLKLTRASDEESGKELLDYISSLEQSESRLLTIIRQVHTQFNEDSFMLRYTSGTTRRCDT